MVRRPSRQTVIVLEALLDEPGEWTYGYDLSKRLGLSSGTLYPLLIRLSDRGHLETRWSDPAQAGRPPRHMYRLTSSGRAWAATVVAREARSSEPIPRPVGEAP